MTAAAARQRGPGTRRRRRHLLVVLALLLLPLHVSATPREAERTARVEAFLRVGPSDEELPVGVFEILWRGLITVYRSWVSPGNMKRCGMYPNCSRYFRLATLRHGGPIGCMMSADRLMRDNGGADSARHYPRILTPHGVLLYDPIEENDFWFRGRGDRRRGAR